MSVDIGFRARLEEFKKGLEDIPGLTKKAGRELTKEWSATTKAWLKDQRDAARKSDQEWDKATASIKQRVESIVPGFTEAREVGGELSTVLGGMSPRAAALAGPIGVLTVGVLALGAGALVAAHGIESMVEDAFDATREIRDLALQTGLSSTTLLALRKAAAGTGTDLADLESAANTLTDKLGDAVVFGSADAAEAFELLGVKTTDAEDRMRSADDVLADVVQRLGEMEDPTERAKLQMELMGDSGFRLTSALGGSAAQLAKLRAEVAPLGESMDTLWESSDNLREANAELDRLYLQLELDVANILVPTLDVLAGRLDKVLESYDGLNDVVETGVKTALKLLPGGNGVAAMLEVWNLATMDTTGAIVDNTEAVEENKGAIASEAELIALGLLSTEESTSAVERNTEARRRNRVEREIAVRSAAGNGEADRAASQLQEKLAALQLDTLSGVERINEEYRRLVFELGDLGKASGDEALAQEAIAIALDLRRVETDQLIRSQRELREEVALTTEELTDTASTSWSSYLQIAEQVTGTVGNLVSTLATRQIDAYERGSKAQKEAALKAFKINQAVQGVNAGINTAVGVTQALASTAPPYSFVLAALVAAAGAVQVGLIASQKPPSYHTGLARAPGTDERSGSDEYLAILRNRERVVNSTGAQLLGDDTISRANRGLQPSGGATVVVQSYRNQVLDVAVQSSMGQPRGALRRVVRDGQRLGHLSR